MPLAFQDTQLEHPVGSRYSTRRVKDVRGTNNPQRTNNKHMVWIGYGVKEIYYEGIFILKIYLYAGIFMQVYLCRYIYYTYNTIFILKIY